MDINLLVVNIGNTRLAVATFAAGELKTVKRIPLAQSADLAGAIAQAWEEIAPHDDPSVAGASVNPTVMESLEHTIVQVTGRPVQWVGREIDLPINVLTERPAETGADRVLNIAAAYEQMGKACVVVDAGSAITIDCCDDTGAFLGGAILPGVEMQLDVLHERTAKLPRVKLEPPKGLIGQSTEQAILQGVYHGIRGAVKELVEQYAMKLGTWPDIICTGGDAAVLFAGWELIHAISPDLTLYGIALAYTNHQIEHGE
jgi:type III pantothenate kinase